MIRLIGYFFGVIIMLGLACAGLLFTYLMHVTKDLPNYELLAKYEPPVTTRIHAVDGSLLEEYARQNRLYIPIQTIPHRLKGAFLSAEDKNFYTHPGIDVYGLARAVVINLRNLGSGRRPMGASTITQQVAKNFLLSSDLTLERKIKELLLSFRIEQTYSKDHILELYINEIFFGMGSYGIASAALIYFNKSVNQLTIAESAYLASLAKAPANYHPIRHKDRALVRRNQIIDLMAENGYITNKEAQKAKMDPLEVTLKSDTVRFFRADYFTEEVRREIIQHYGEKKLYEGGLSVRTTLEPAMQKIAEKVMKKAFVEYDQNQGYRGPKDHIDDVENWTTHLSKLNFSDCPPEWRIAVVLEVSPSSLAIGMQSSHKAAQNSDLQYATIELSDTKWALNHKVKGHLIREKSLQTLFKVGDIIYVEKKEKTPNHYLLRQFPSVSGGMIAMDPHTGRVLAMVGGFSWSESKFNRATRARRQPGSAFKPVVYAAALDNGYTPASVVMDGPVSIQTGTTVWTPKNYDNKFSGPSTLRSGIERSRNLMTVRLANDMGMNIVSEYAERFGLYKKLAPHIAMSLGAGETTVMRMVSAYAIMANGGLKIKPSLIDRIQDRYGKTIFRYNRRTCIDCSALEWNHQPEPEISEEAEQVLDPMTAYQITSMMIGVVQRGTAARLKDLERPIAGKTGTTNNEKDAWFIGYTPNLVVGLYLGFDKPSSLGRGVSGGNLAAPVFKEFIQEALENVKPLNFHIPEGMNLLTINRKTGMHSLPGDPDTIIEAFKPGTRPADSYWVIGADDNIEIGEILSPQASQAIHEGEGEGLY